MTEVIYEQDCTCTELTLFGHCNAGRINGMDLCCCSVSMLVFTMLESLKSLKLQGFRHSYGGGWCHVKFANKGRDYKKAECIIGTIMNGFGLLQKKYPENVKIINSQKGVSDI